MFTQRNKPSFRYGVPLGILVLLMAVLFVGLSPASAAIGAVTINLRTTVPVSNLVLHPPSPCNQGISLSGDFAIQAHIVWPVAPIAPIVTLQLDATGISGTGLTDGAPYVGSMGTSANSQIYPPGPPVMPFAASFSLIPAQPNQYPTDSVCTANVTFQTQLVQGDNGVLALSANLVEP